MTENAKHIFKNIVPLHRVLYILLLFIIACQQKPDNTGKLSSSFLPVYNHTNKLYDNNELALGIRYLDSAYNYVSNPNVDDKFQFYKFHFLYNKKVKHNHQAALLYADSMMAMANKNINQKQYASNFAEANFAKGDAYFDLKQFNDAYQFFYQGYLTAKNYVDNLALSDYTYRMGMIMYQQGHYKLAIKYFKESYSQNLTIPENFIAFFRRQELLDNIGLSYRHLNKPDSALFYFDETLRCIDMNCNKFKTRDMMSQMARGVVYGNKAEVYIERKAYAPAIELLNKSISINMQHGMDNNDAQLAEIKLAQIYADTHQNDKLLNLLVVMRRQLDTIKNDIAEEHWNRLMGNYYLQQNNLAKAIKHIQRYDTLKDSIAKKSNLLKESDITQQLANFEKQREIDTLSTDNKLQLIYLYVAIALAIMAIIIISLVYRNWKRSKKDLQTVSALNRQINEQNGILENALKELNNNSIEKDRILRTVAHDLRNPIGGIASLTALMAEDDYTAEQKKLLKLVKETSVNSLELINEILEATNIASIQFKLEPVEINGLVSSSVELMRFKAAEKGQEIVLELLEESVDLYISREKTWRVISNLISNAIKFSPIGSDINIKLSANTEQVTIAFKDSGIGIPDDIKKQVFNMFTTAQRPGTAGEKSFGLGLSICKQIMDKHNGSIWFESNTIGTTFYISLPLLVFGKAGKLDNLS